MNTRRDPRLPSAGDASGTQYSYTPPKACACRSSCQHTVEMACYARELYEMLEALYEGLFMYDPRTVCVHAQPCEPIPRKPADTRGGIEHVAAELGELLSRYVVRAPPQICC
ncbi:unnamed protein product, partial [Laminaria digitata]